MEMHTKNRVSTKVTSIVPVYCRSDQAGMSIGRCQIGEQADDWVTHRVSPILSLLRPRAAALLIVRQMNSQISKSLSPQLHSFASPSSLRALKRVGGRGTFPIASKRFRSQLGS